MLIAIGLDSDPTLAHFARTTTAAGFSLDLLNLRGAVEGDWRIPTGGVEPAVFEYSGRRILLDPMDAIYCRLIDLSPTQASHKMRRRWRALMLGLSAWLERADGPVANRPGHAADNGSKPLHEAWLRSIGFDVPPSLTSANRDRLVGFASAGPTVAKSVAGIRADSRAVTADDFRSFAPEQGPVHLQRRVFGRDVRLHVVDEDVHGELIESEAVDYRSSSARFRTLTPPADLAEKVAQATRAAGLMFAGWDFKLDAEGRFWCLEANPMPGYDGYDMRANGAISRSLAARLTSPR
jgi:glutathione synthase/RimK-type ligase-like ATP-grasp enzyme